MPVFDVGSFKAEFDGGARTYLFYCVPNIPDFDMDNDYVYVKSTSLPGSDIDEHVLTYHGFDYKVHGKRTYSDWTITFISDKTYLIRSAFEDWLNSISSPKSNYASIGDRVATQTLIPLSYSGKFIYKKEGQPYNIIFIVDAWPKSVGNIEFDYSTQDVAQFEVTFSYKYYEMETTTQDFFAQ
jgi:hypothetical protein